MVVDHEANRRAAAAVADTSPWESSFACVDVNELNINELWASAFPLEEDKDPDEATDSITTNPEHHHSTAHQHPTLLQGSNTCIEASDFTDNQSIKSSSSSSSSAAAAAADVEQGQVHETGLSPDSMVRQEIVSPTDDNEDDDSGVWSKSSPPKDRARGLHTAVLYFKYLCSGALLVFSIVVVTAAIFQEQTTATAKANVQPAVAFIFFWCLVLWLALLEGGLNVMVGLKPINSALYANSHPFTYRSTQMGHRGDNLERFIVGRQFLDLSCVFLTNFLVSSIDGASVLGLPASVCNAFLGSGLAVILVTIVIGQLVTQMNAAHCMLDFINNRIFVASTFVALTLENSGLLHATYLLRIVVSKLAGRTIQSNEGELSRISRAWFWARVAMSTALLIFALTATIAALFQGNTIMWDDVPPTVSLLLLVALIVLVGNLDALQIALFAVVHLPPEELSKHPVAKRNCELTFRETNLQSFLVGRQILQTIIQFMIARITTLDISESADNIFGVSDTVQSIFNTGVLGALITTILASLAWRLLASSFPMAFLNNPLAIFFIRFCLLVENTGVCAVSWLLASVHKRLWQLHVDETYIGTYAERAAQEQNDNKNYIQDHTLDHSTDSEESST